MNVNKGDERDKIYIKGGRGNLRVRRFVIFKSNTLD